MDVAVQPLVDFFSSKQSWKILLTRSTVTVIASAIVGISSFPFWMWNLRKKWVGMELERSRSEDSTGPAPRTWNRRSTANCGPCSRNEAFPFAGTECARKTGPDPNSNHPIWTSWKFQTVPFGRVFWVFLLNETSCRVGKGRPRTCSERRIRGPPDFPFWTTSRMPQNDPPDRSPRPFMGR